MLEAQGYVDLERKLMHLMRDEMRGEPEDSPGH
jgi:hypothetical protein